MISAPLRIRVRGSWACFTRPEFHVERVSYPVITPSAARGEPFALATSERLVQLVLDFSTPDGTHGFLPL